jgi:hypothetical protein
VLIRAQALTERVTFCDMKIATKHHSQRCTRESRTTVTPLGAVIRGVIAGTAGTAAMDGLLYARYRHGGGEIPLRAWELSSSVTDWDDAPAPAQVGKRLVEGLFQRELPATLARRVNNITHWSYGMLAAAQYGVIAGSLTRPRVRQGPVFGATVWASGYVVLPAAKLYQQIWEYDPITLAKDLSAHLVYGLATAATFSALWPRSTSGVNR